MSQQYLDRDQRGRFLGVSPRSEGVRIGNRKRRRLKKRAKNGNKTSEIHRNFRADERDWGPLHSGCPLEDGGNWVTFGLENGGAENGEEGGEPKGERRVKVRNKREEEIVRFLTGVGKRLVSLKRGRVDAFRCGAPPTTPTRPRE